MEKGKVVHVLSVLLDELTQNLWHDAVASWNLSGDEGESIVLTLLIYENYSIPLSRLTKMILKFDVPIYRLNFRNNGGTMEILIVLSKE